jgi:hypothetical protein
LHIDIAAEFSIYLNYVRALRFEDKPDYVYLRELFRAASAREGYAYDFVFDWTVQIHVCWGYVYILEEKLVAITIRLCQR